MKIVQVIATILLLLVSAVTVLGQLPTPTISGITPNSVTAGSPGFTLTVNGTSYISSLGLGSSTVRWNGSAIPTTYVSSTQLRATVDASLLVSAGTATVDVLNPGGIASNQALFSIIAPSPTITGISPSSAAAGSPQFTLTVTGANYIASTLAAGSTVRWNGAGLPTVFVSPTQLRATVDASLLANPGTATIDVFNGATETVSNAVQFSITAPAGPTISSINPTSVAVGSPQFTITVTGANYVASGAAAGSRVRWNGTTIPTVFLSSTQLQGTVSASLVTAAGPAVIDVINPNGLISNQVQFLITQQQPLNPTISKITPASITAGSEGFILVVEGANYIPAGAATAGSIVRWNGTPLSTTYISATQLQASVGASLVSTAGTAVIDVANSEAMSSNQVQFSITAPPSPTITAIDPASVIAGSPQFTLTVTGANFLAGGTSAAGSKVRWNGSGLPTSYVSATQLKATVGSSLVAGAGKAVIDVANPDGGTSNQVEFLITAPLPNPTITSLNPASVIAGSAAFNLNVAGANYVSGSVVRWNGSALATTYGSPTQLQAAVTASLVANAGKAVVDVANPNGGTSNQAQFTIIAPLSITTSSPLPAGVAGSSYSTTFAATGGTGPYTWSLASGSLPAGLAFSTAGTLAGTSTTGGSFSFTVQVVDSTGTAATKAFTLQIGLPAIPTLSITGLADTTGPAQQPSFNLQLSGPAPMLLTGKLTLTFTSNTVNALDDPAIQFSTGGRVLDFTISAGETTAFKTPGYVQTGTVAGRITLTVTSLTMGGQSVLPSIPPSRSIQIVQSAPVITSMKVVLKSYGFDMQITGYSTTRQVTQANFTFSGASLQTTQLTVPVETEFSAWYTSAASTPFGSTFLYTQPFTVLGIVGDIDSVSATIANSVGNSAPATAAVPKK